jgi:cell wall-associated NlpC family hydrolase
MLSLTPHATARHWSAAYLDLPWAPAGEGPDVYDCWGLVRKAQLNQYGRAMPALGVGAIDATPDQWSAIRDMVQRSPWRRTDTRLREGDVLLMLNAEGKPHIGVVIELPRLSLLHAVGGLNEHGAPYGAVRIDALDQLAVWGFGHFEGWRYAVGPLHSHPGSAAVRSRRA